MSQSQQIQDMLHAFIRCTPLAMQSLVAVARRELPQPEFNAVRKYLENPQPRLRGCSPHDALKEGCQKLALHFRSGKQAPPLYTLPELIHFAESAGQAKTSWAFLNEDLFRLCTKPRADPQNKGHSLISNVLRSLHGRPISEVAPSYTFDKTFTKVIDLYYVTEREIYRFARTQYLPCGPKAFEYLENMLTSQNLPPLSEVAR